MTLRDLCLNLLLGPILVVGFASIGWADMSEPVPMGRVQLVCTEGPMRVVSFGEAGQVNYGEQPPTETAPVTLTITKTGAGQDFNVDSAAIETDTHGLAAGDAVWIKGKQIEAQNGRFRINLENLMMTLTEVEPDGSARFRRFACEERGDSTD